MKFIEKNKFINSILIVVLVIVFINLVKVSLIMIGLEPAKDLFANAVFIAIVLGGIGIMLISQFNGKLALDDIGLSSNKNAVKQFMIGVLLAAIITCAIVGMLHVVGARFLKLGFETGAYGEFIKTIVCGFIIATFAGVVEELAFRGYLFTKFQKEKGTISAIVITTVFFTIVHAPSSSYTELLSYLVPASFGVMFCLIRIYYKSLWITIGLHFAYDFFMLSIIGIGSENLGRPLFIFEYLPKKVILFGNHIGDVSSLFPTIVALLVSGMLVICNYNKKNIIYKKEL
ncbi:CPBP family intramembrane glutamic endopeptidase [Oceanirhabdus sp. W0125-5]|uniref:CPBP family intramembrane glutamic endopeptidase n=1 Tax=Oceanirhabdus sp. W0125-5 TaxID=2999116 RepID=UPI0022F31FD4|nr:type II CAAX endopeptidase family protein [Oceanirhabdus sp. W0125-5]WBW97291.1 type II CAAX endopeptidase family protein [Oceanirhabdus sp. W0125-5]